MAMTAEGKARRIASLEAREKAVTRSLDTVTVRQSALVADLAEIRADLEHVRNAPVKGEHPAVPGDRG